MSRIPRQPRRSIGGERPRHRRPRRPHRARRLLPAPPRTRRHQRPTRRLTQLLVPIADGYDVALVDCAPGITLTSESVFDAADALLVPTIPTTLSERTLDQLSRFLAEQNGAPMLLPFASMLDRRRRLQRDLVAHLTRDIPGSIQTPIPNAGVIERMGVERAAVAVFAPTSAAARAFSERWAEIAARVWN